MMDQILEFEFQSLRSAESFHSNHLLAYLLSLALDVSDLLQILIVID